MKVNRSIFLILIFTAFILSSGLKAQNEYKLMDYDENMVDFFLVSKDRKTVLKSINGILKEAQIKNHTDKLFTLHFDNHLAYLLYHSDLYFENGSSIKDKHIVYDKVKSVKLEDDSDGIFFVRRREIMLVDDK